MPKFLPEPVLNTAYGIAHPAAEGFESESFKTMKNIAQNMAIDAVQDVGRIPSLMSRAYSFYTDLFPGEYATAGAEKRTGRADALVRSRREFRGIASALALQKLLQIDISLKSFDPSAGASADANPFRAVFRDGYSQSPGFGSGVWSQFRYLVIRSKVADRIVEEPLCGLSPYTLFYPAARRLAFCRSIFWYDSDQGRWWDPTSDWGQNLPPNLSRVSPEVIKILRGYMRLWLDRALSNQPDLVWQKFGVSLTRAVNIKAELAAWRSQLNQLEFIQPPADAMVSPAELHLLKDSMDQAILVPVLEQKISLSEPEGRIVSELPRFRGRVLLSEDILTDSSVRICGGLSGGGFMEGALKDLPMTGEEFTLRKGNDGEYHLKEPYVLIDKLLFDKLHILADSTLARNFHGLKTGPDEYWMYPFRPELFRYLDLSKLLSPNESERLSQASAVRLGDGNADSIVRVEFKIGDKRFAHNYSQPNRDRADKTGGAFDVRIWPNFRFLTSPRTPARESDRAYYFRIRQKPIWELKTQVLAQAAFADFQPAQNEVCSFEPDFAGVGWPETPLPYRSADCFRFETRQASPGLGKPAGAAVKDWEPMGLYFEGQGACLFRLADAAHPGGAEPIKWRVAVDFGASNTCVAFLPLQSGMATKFGAIRFELQTDTLHDVPQYEELTGSIDEGRRTEGAAAVLDFPYKYNSSENSIYLTEKSHFPTLVVVRQQAAPTAANFMMPNGLIFPRNVILDNQAIGRLLKQYPPPMEPDRRVFRVISDCKNKNEAYRKTFLWHLYKMITYEAARRGAVVTEAAFSFPRAFDRDKIRGFKDDINAIFSQSDSGISISSWDFLTESEAVQRWLAHEGNQDQYDHMVVDIGGGTTDFLAVLARSARLQASYYLAGGCINEYFSASPGLPDAMLKAILAAVEEKPPGQELNIQKGQRKRLADLASFLSQASSTTISDEDFKNYSQQAFFGMLGMMEDRHYSAVVSDLAKDRPGNGVAAERRAICGFFYTLVLFYTGIVYQAGRLMRQQKLGSANLQINFIGNGGRFYRLLQHRSVNFDKVMQRVFQVAAGKDDAVVTIKLDEDGKALVAKGLLIPATVDGDKSTFVPAPVVPDEDSMKYLRASAGGAGGEFADLVEFITLLSHQLPGGRLDGVKVIPFASNDLLAELTALFRNMVEPVRRAEVASAERLMADEGTATRLLTVNPAEAEAYAEAALATEPVFISRLKCLLDAIRSEYATQG